MGAPLGPPPGRPRTAAPPCASTLLRQPLPPPHIEGGMSEPLTLTLSKGDLTLAVAPSIGGAIAGFWRNGLALMRETPEQALRDGLVRLTSSYPLIPYSNRIAQGRFSFHGAEHRLAL